jgi:hypothetical protein
MNVGLALLGAALVAAGVIWRLKLSGFGAGEQAQGSITPPSGSATSPPSPGARPSPPSLRPSRGARPTQPSMFDLEKGIRWDQEDKRIARRIVQERRRNERILLKIPVQIVGTYARGEAFTDRTSTIAVSREGAFIGFKKPLRTGDQLTITHVGTRQSCPFRVSDSHERLSNGMYAWFVENLEPELNFWQIHFPEKPPEPTPEDGKTVPVLLECGVCHSAEMAELKWSEYVGVVARRSLTKDCPKCGAPTEWRFRVLEEEEQPVPPPAPESRPPIEAPSAGEERRREDRILAKLLLRIRLQDGRAESTMTENVSKTGACCISSLDMIPGDAIFVEYEFSQADGQEEIPAHITWRCEVGEGARTLYGIKLERPAPSVA